MSLASFLLRSKPFGKEKEIDTELDALFHSQVCCTVAKEKKKKKKRSSDGHTHDEPDSKRPKPSLADGPSLSLPRESMNNRVNIIPEPVLDSDASDVPKPGNSKGISSHESAPETLDEDGEDPSTLVHETLQKKKPYRLARRKYIPSDETLGRRDARTIFIGNLAPDVAIKRPLQKQLHRHILSFLPTAKIESTRFRSVAFQIPTSKHPDVNDEMKKNKQPRRHDRDRASSWRDERVEDISKTDEKKFLTPSQKKRIAFINKEIHSDANSVHAYIVFAYPPPPHSGQASLPPPLPVMDPFEAARLAVEMCNGTMFLDRLLRVDAVIKRSTAENLSDNTLFSSAVGDPKLTIFVGNLDFASKEEDLRVFFEGIVSAECGPPDTTGLQNGDKPKSWVTHTRMIRDKDTQLGKGFAYVQFLDRTCVDEILALEPGKLKFAKRKLRVQRCKSLPTSTFVKDVPLRKSAQTANRAPAPPVPESLGEKLAKLTKDERKRVKAMDADRVAWRMAKKKARMAMAKEVMPLQTKQRERVRKTKKPGGPSSKTTRNRRVRSEKSIAKRNVKK